MPSRYESRASGDLTIITQSEPTLELAQIAQPIGHAAWANAMTERTDEQIRYSFDENNPNSDQYLFEKMQSKVGRFAGVIAVIDGVKVGYAWGTDDVGNYSIGKQKIYTYAGKIVGKKPFVWGAQINVTPSFQDQGVGAVMFEELLKQFDDDQRGAVYVFEENKKAFRWFSRRRFEPKPPKSYDPNDSEDYRTPDRYFGPGKHVKQFRLESESIEESRARNKTNHSGLRPYNLIKE